MAINQEQLERLIEAQEHNTNAVMRLVRLLEAQERKKTERKPSGRMRRAVLEPSRPLVVTPMVEAALNRALAKAGR